MKERKWVLFFEEDGEPKCGSDWCKPISCQPHTLYNRIMSGEYSVPKTAVGFIIMTTYDFMNLSYDEIKQEYKMYGVKIER